MDECAVALCGNEGKLVPICSNGHRMHLECLKGWVRSREEPSCPSCRDPYLSEMKAFFQDNPYVHQPPSPGPAPNPFDFPAPPQIMNQLLAQAYTQRHRTVTTTRTVQAIPGGYMHVETVRGAPPAPPLLTPRAFRRPQYYFPRPPAPRAFPRRV